MPASAVNMICSNPLPSTPSTSLCPQVHARTVIVYNLDRPYNQLSGDPDGRYRRGGSGNHGSGDSRERGPCWTLGGDGGRARGGSGSWPQNHRDGPGPPGEEG